MTHLCDVVRSRLDDEMTTYCGLRILHSRALRLGRNVKLVRNELLASAARIVDLRAHFSITPESPLD